MKTRYDYTTQAQIRHAFWDEHPELDAIAPKRGTRSKGQNAQNADTRMTFIDWVDDRERSGRISSALADRVTLQELEYYGN